MTNKLFAFFVLFIASFGFSADRVGHYDDLQFLDGSSHVSVQAASGTATWTMLLPPNDGSANQVLTSDGSGVTTWTGPKADSGANSDITSLSGLTTPLSIAQGGTAATSASAARSSLGAAASGANSDITSITGLSTPLALNQGGTAATTASGARTSLSAAQSGSNSDITALSGLTTPLSVGQGGTGSSTASGARSNLSAASSGSNSDITSLSGLTTALSIAQGGTGQTTATAAFNALDPMTAKGSLITHDGTNSVVQTVGSNDQILIADSTQTNGIRWGSVPSADVYGIWTDADEFFTTNQTSGGIGKLGWLESSAGTGATSLRKSGVSGHPGIYTVRPGTVATGRAAIGLGGDGTNSLILADGSTEVTWIFRSAQTLSAFEMVIVGLGDTVATVGDQVNGAYFQLLGSPTPDTDFFCVTANASTRTRVDTGIAYTANQWYKLRITINAAGTSVQCNIDGTNAGTAITTNIPSSAVSPMIKVDGIAGGTASDTDVDLFRIVKTLTTTR